MGFETCHCGRGTVCVCNEHQSAESSPPTTVRGWLGTVAHESMRKGLAHKAIIAGISEMPADSLRQSVWHIFNYSREGYYLGIHAYLEGHEPNNPSGYARYEDGYNAAKEAFGGQNQHVGMSLQASADGKHFADVTLSNPSYVAISPERLAELERIEALYNERIELLGENVNPDALWEKMQLNADKAAKWDTFGPKMRYIINTFEDLEGLKK